jgi:PAS domain S-box-containing protein
MYPLDPFVLGIILLVIGLSSILLILVVWRVIARYRKKNWEYIQSHLITELNQHDEAVLLVLKGGRIAFLNQQAQEWFGVTEGNLDVERLGRRAHPSSAFFGLCANEGQAHFSLDGRSLEGTSYHIPHDDGSAILVSLRQPQFIVESGDGSIEGDRAINLITELNQTITASLDLETTLLAILEAIERLIPSDYAEITIWDPKAQLLYPYRLAGIHDTARQVERRFESYHPDEGFAGFLIHQGQPTLISDIDNFKEVNLAKHGQSYPFQSLIGVPLITASDLTGTMQFASLTKDQYTKNDLEILRILSGQAAVALNNALLYEEEERRAKELAGLAKLAQVVSSQHNLEDVYAKLVESIVPLIDVEILGFLIYDERKQILAGQKPFIGLPATVLDWTQTLIKPESEAEKLIASGETIVSTDAPSDQRLEALNLDNLARAAGIHHTALTPLTAGGRFLGYLQAGDKSDGSAFDQNDLRLLSIIAGQAAPIIENASLVQKSKRRAQRAETLRRIASLTGSNATIDEILKFSLQDLARLFGADIAAIFLLDEDRGELRLHKPSLFGIFAEAVSHQGRLPTADPQFLQTVTKSQQPYRSDDIEENDGLLPLYRSFLSNLDIRSTIITPLVVRERGIGEIMFGVQTASAFNSETTQTAITVSAQLASAIERASLYSQTDDSLRRRLDQLTAVTSISRELNSSLDLGNLLQRVYDESLFTTGADCGTILLFDLSDSTSELRSPKIMLHLGDSIGTELHPLEQVVLEREEALIVNDFEQTAILRQDSGALIPPALPAHEGIRSAMIVPIAYQEQVAGLIHLHAGTAHRFDDAAKQVAETLAIQAAIALGNAHRYQEQVRRGEQLNRRAETLAKLLETTQSIHFDQTPETSLYHIAKAIQTATPFETVLISIYDAESKSLQRVSGAGINPDDMDELQSHHQAWESVNRILKNDFKIGHSYFIPYEQMPLLPADIHTLTVLPQENSPLEADTMVESAWHPEDMLVVPLQNIEGEPLGLISVDAPRNNLRPDRTTIETLEIFSSQAALFIESHQKFAEIRVKLDEVQNKLQITKKSAESAERSLPLLRQKDLEQTVTIEHLSQRVQRISAGMDIAEIVNRQADRQHVLMALAKETLTRMDMDIVLVVEPGPRGPHLLYTHGTIPEDVNIEALLGQRNPLYISLRSGESILESHLNGQSEWGDAPLLQVLDTKSFACLPIQTVSGPDAAVLALSRSPVAPFSDEDKQLYSLLSSQVAITLQNLDLLTETSQRLAEVNLLLDFSRQLGSSEPDEILRTLVDSAIHVVPGAQAGMAALWDATEEILVPRAALGYVDNSTFLTIKYRSGEALPGRVFESGEAMIVNEIEFAKHYQLPPKNLAQYRDATDGRIPISSLVVPILGTSERWALGVILLDNFQSQAAFTESDQALVLSLTQQTALNLENTQLLKASEERASQLGALTGVATTITSKLHPDDLVTILLDQLATVLPFDTGTLWLHQRKNLIVRATRGFSEQDNPIGLKVAVEDSTLLRDMLADGQPLFVGDVREDERFPQAEEDPHLSWLGIPLIASGEVIGVIALQKTETDFYTPENIYIATAFAGQAAVALENAHLYEETRSLTVDLEQRVNERTSELAREHQRTETALNIITELTASLDLEYVLNRTLEVLNDIIDAEQITVLISRPGEDKLFHVGTVGYTPTPSPGQVRATAVKADHSLAGWIIHHRQPALIDNILEDSRWTTNPERPTKHRSAIGVPLMVGAEALGALLFFHRNIAHFSADQLDLVQAAANQVAVAVNNAELYRLIRDQAEDLGSMLRDQQIEASRSRSILEAVADGVLVTNAVNQITLFNISAEDILGLKRDQVIGRSLEQFTGLFGNAAKHWMATIQTWSQDPLDIQTGETYAEQINLEDERVIAVNLAPVSMRGDFLGTVSIFRDITHQVEVDRLKSEFVATVSHELRTPMTSIKGYVDILLMGATGELSEQQRNFLDIVKDNTDRLEVLVNDLLDLSRIEAGSVILSTGPLDLYSIVKQAINNLEARSLEDSKPMEIRAERSPELPLALGDPDRVRQILNNMLENAYFYTPKEGKITVSLQPVDDQIQIDVQDNGIGIPTEAQQHVFERFYRGEHPNVLATSGTGLGLSVVQHLVDMHKGRIWLESSGIPGEGTTFSFTLPIYKAED